jgi:hypothetical protein
MVFVWLVELNRIKRAGHWRKTAEMRRFSIQLEDKRQLVP